MLLFPVVLTVVSVAAIHISVYYSQCIYAIKYAATNNNNTCPLPGYYQAGLVADPNDPTYVKAQQQSENNGIPQSCDKGNRYPLCYNAGYYYGVKHANDDNSYYALHPSEKRYLYRCSPFVTANFCAGNIHGYSHTFVGHISNASEIWSEGYLTGYYSGKSFTPYFPMNGSNPVSCTEGPSLFCNWKAQDLQV